MNPRVLLLVGGLSVLAAVAALLGIRAATGTVADDVGQHAIAVECSGWTGWSEDCRGWGEAVLAAGAPSTTFEIADVVRVRLDRPLFGFGPTCVAEYFLGRYPDEVAWTEDVPCPDG